MSYLKLPENPRAAALLAEYDQRYIKFLEDLPEGIQDLARMKATYSGLDENDLFSGFSQMNPGLTCIPWMFWEHFSLLEDAIFLQLAEAGALTVLASVLIDHLVDGQVERTEETILLQQALYRSGRNIFQSFFTCDSYFWQDIVRLEQEHIKGLTAEITVRRNPEKFSYEWFTQFVGYKFSPILVTAAAFTAATNLPPLLGHIEASVKSLAVASQLLDDIGDWEQDLDQRHLTYFLCSLMPSNVWSRSVWPSKAEIRTKIDQSWSDVDALTKVIEWLDRSITSVQELECPSWIEYLEDYKRIAMTHSDVAVARQIQRGIRPLINQTPE